MGRSCWQMITGQVKQEEEKQKEILDTASVYMCR